MGEISEAVGEAADLFDDQVDGFCAAVGDAAGVEVGEHLLPPGLEGAAEPSHLGDRAGREAGDDLLRDPSTFRRELGVGKIRSIPARDECQDKKQNRNRSQSPEVGQGNVAAIATEKAKAKR